MSPRIAHLALLSGLCPLVPVPFLDGWLERRATRALLRRVAEDAGQPLDDATLHLLTEDPSHTFLGCLGVLVVWPLKKLFRTALFVFLIKDMVDAATRAALRAAMVQAALPRLPADAPTIRDVITATLARWNYSPISRILLRGERPSTTWIVAGGSGRLVGWLYEKGGGGAILTDFLRRLEGTP